MKILTFAILTTTISGKSLFLMKLSNKLNKKLKMRHLVLGKKQLFRLLFQWLIIGHSLILDKRCNSHRLPSEPIILLPCGS